MEGPFVAAYVFEHKDASSEIVSGLMLTSEVCSQDGERSEVNSTFLGGGLPPECNSEVCIAAEGLVPIRVRDDSGNVIEYKDRQPGGLQCGKDAKGRQMYISALLPQQDPDEDENYRLEKIDFACSSVPLPDNQGACPM